MNRRGMSVHVGINHVDPEHYEGWNGKLRACENDARSMAELAVAEGFDTRTLLSEEARAENLFEAIRKAADLLQGGDMFLLTYAGHGAKVPDNDGDEPESDAHDEAFVLYDRMVLDDELHALLGEFRPEVRIAVVADSCFSGGSKRKGPPVSGRRSRQLDPAKAAEVYQHNRTVYDGLRASARRGGRSTAPHTLFLAACEESELADENDQHGYFTGALLEVWDGGRFREAYSPFHREITRLTPTDQHPVLLRDVHLNWSSQRPFTIEPHTRSRRAPATASSSGRSPADNWDEVLVALRAANVEWSPLSRVNGFTELTSRGSRGGTTVRAFWWGFHIEIDHDSLKHILTSASGVNTMVGLIGGSIPTPAAPFITAAAGFVAASIEIVRKVDSGHGVYISMSWFAPGVFVPTSVVGSRGVPIDRVVGKELQVGDQLLPGEGLASPDGSHTLTLTKDGRLLVSEGQAVRWSAGEPTQQLLRRPIVGKLLPDGQFVLLNLIGAPVWSTSLRGGPGDYRLRLLNSGNLTVVDDAGTVVWETTPAAGVRSTSITATQTSEVGHGKHVSSAVTLYRNGTLVLDSANHNDSWIAGLRARTMVVVSDDRGRAIWVSQIFEDPTRCSVPDVSCASYGRVTHVQYLPEAVGEFGTHLDIYHGDAPSYIDLRNRLIDVIKTVADVAEALKNAWEQLQKT